MEINIALKKMYTKNVYEIDQELGGGELPLSMCPGMGNRPARKKKVANSQGYAREGGGGGGSMITCQIEPGIIVSLFCGSSQSWRYAIHWLPVSEPRAEASHSAFSNNC